MTYGTLINTQTIAAGGAASIDFNSIPQTYTDILIVLSGRLSIGSGVFEVKLNSTSSTSNEKYLYGDGTTGSSGNNGVLYGLVDSSAYTANTFGNTQIYIPNYAGSNTKIVSVDGVTENNATTSLQKLTTATFGSSAVTSVNLVNSFAQYSTASLYGIK